MKIDQTQYDKIAAEIHSDSSPVGIDAKKTHILILQLLTDIDQRLKRMEDRMNSTGDGSPNANPSANGNPSE